VNHPNPDNLNQYWESLIGSALVAGSKIIALLIVFGIVNLIFKYLLRGLESIIRRRLDTRAPSDRDEINKRIKTLNAILRKIIYSVIWSLAILMSLAQVGINIGPILAAAGVVGLAVSFGAQNLIKDFLNGFFLILENQIRIGDMAVINSKVGLVEAINLRTTVIRDASGVVHIFPNGSINSLSNMTREWSAYVFDIHVPYTEDTDRVMEIMRRTAETMRADAAFAPNIPEPFEIYGLDDFSASGLVIQARVKTLPSKQWEVAREYRLRLKRAFDTAGIRL